MGKFCSNCGKEISENQDICLGCGVFLNKDYSTSKKEKGKHNGYKKTTSIIMIVLGACMFLGASGDIIGYKYPILVYSIPGLLGIISGILTLNSKKRTILLLISGILLFIGAIINFVGIMDVSIYMILAIIFGIFNIIYSKDM